jgi:penicillin-binding protein 1A
MGQLRMFTQRDIAALDSMLVQVLARGTGQAAQLSRGHTAGKTGTSQDYRDAWFIGYTKRLVTGIWMGNDDNSPMEQVSGGKYPARLWHDYMEAALDVEVKNHGAGPARKGSDDGFSRMLDRWSSGDFGGGFSGFTGNDVPVYNP